ncbi:tryptophan synthase beta subunit-like PLP-dependent enzyme [Marasmius fiardii PR-910]|nr:tryptophan synthase beta subunit-like PLP-dependent enzyme [Marasmius fiardii PR-910]
MTSSLVFRNPSARSYSVSSASPSQTSSIRDFHRKFFSSKFTGSPQTASRTPLRSLPAIAKELDIAHVFVKDESCRFGLPAFKILGASWAIFSVLAKKLRIDVNDGNGVVDLELFRQQLAVRNGEEKIVLFTATDGNHGRAVARVAKMFGLQAKIFVPEAVEETSRDHIRSEGAEVMVVQADYDETVQIAAREAGDKGVLIQDTSWPGYEEIPKLIVQGYSTLFAELNEQLAEHRISPTLVVVPVGVGSLAHSAVQFYRSKDLTSARGPSPSILTVEPSTAACLNTSLHTGKSTSIQTTHTVMDGLNCGTVSYSAWPDLLSGVDLSVVVSDDEVIQAVEDLKALGVRAGPCGAAPLAALRALPDDVLDKSTVVVLICTEGRSVI